MSTTRRITTILTADVVTSRLMAAALRALKTHRCVVVDPGPRSKSGRNGNALIMAKSGA